MPSKRPSSANRKQAAIPETCEFNKEQQDEVRPIIEELSNATSDLSSMNTIIREMWRLYVRLLPVPGAEQQWEKNTNIVTARRGCVQTIKRTIKRQPTLDDAIAALPQLAGLSVSTQEQLQKDLAAIGKPQPRRSTVEILLQKAKKSR